jgi:hypothetical protein
MRSNRRHLGLTRGIIDAVHIWRMGKAAVLFCHFVDRQDSPDGRTNYGRPWKYEQLQREIKNGSKIPKGTLRNWVRRLKKFGYIDTKVVRFGRTVTGFTVRIMDPKKWAVQLNLQFEPRNKIVEFGTGSRNRSSGKEASPGDRTDRTVRHQLSGGSSTVEHRTPKAKAASSTLAPRSSALRTLENQRQKAARLERWISCTLELFPSRIPQHVQEKLREQRNELEMTRDVIHEYELRLKAVSA